MWFFALFCAGGLLCGFLMFRSMRFVPEIGSEIRDIHSGIRSEAPPRTPFSVIIPARDEESNIATLLTSIAQSTLKPAEVIVVDDSSTDNTAAVASSLDALVLRGSPLPSGWTGKTWACKQGADAATTDILFFLDADTCFTPGGLARTMALFHRLPATTALSILPYHVTRRTYEELSLFFNILMAAGAGGFSRLAPPQLFGQSLLIHRELYDRSGGHAAVRQHVLENLELAQHIHSAGGAQRTALGRGILMMRMCPHGLAQLRESWQKGFAGGANATPRVILLMSIYWLTAAMLIAIVLVAGASAHPSVPLAFYVAFVLETFWIARSLGSFRPWTVALYPAPLVVFFMIFGRSLWLRRTAQHSTWKGRRL